MPLQAVIAQWLGPLLLVYEQQLLSTLKGSHPGYNVCCCLQVHEQPLMLAVADTPDLLEQLTECNQQVRCAGTVITAQHYELRYVH